MSEYAILDEQHNIVECDMMTWAEAREKRHEDFRVARTEIGDRSVSTVFLGLNHSFHDGPPLWFETMVFKPSDRYKQIDEVQDDGFPMCRCETWEQAVQGHEEICGMVRRSLHLPKGPDDENLAE